MEDEAVEAGPGGLQCQTIGGQNREHGKVWRLRPRRSNPGPIVMKVDFAFGRLRT